MHPDKRTILIVDDTKLIIDRVIGMLEELEIFKLIRQAQNYGEAVDSLAQLVPDIALLDINLPDKSGIVLLSYIKKQYPEIKVVMLSNRSSQYYRDLCRKIGALYFIDKSKDFEQIPDILTFLTAV